MSILDNESHFSRFLVSTGFRKTSASSISPYIAERKLYKYVKKALSHYDLFEDDLQSILLGLRDMKKEDIMNMWEDWEKDPSVNTIKNYINKAEHLKIYNENSL